MTLDLPGFAAYLERAAAGIDMGPTLGARDWIAQDTAAGFRDSVSPDGTPFAPIHHRIGKPLVDTGLMYLSVIDQINEGSIGSNTLHIRIDHPWYAAIHQSGTAKIKARPWLGIRDATKQRIYGDAVMEIMRFIVHGRH